MISKVNKDYLIVILPILIGTVIYILFYPKTILFNSLLFQIFPGIENFRSGLSYLTPKLDKIFIKSIPTALWAFSYTYGQLIILFEKPHFKINKYILLFNIIIILGIEIFQKESIKIIPGTYDIADLFFNILAVMLATAFYLYLRKV